MAATSISKTRLNFHMANFPNDHISGCCLCRRLHFKFPGVSGDAASWSCPVGSPESSVMDILLEKHTALTLIAFHYFTSCHSQGSALDS